MACLLPVLVIASSKQVFVLHGHSYCTALPIQEHAASQWVQPNSTGLYCKYFYLFSLTFSYGQNRTLSAHSEGHILFPNAVPSPILHV